MSTAAVARGRSSRSKSPWARFYAKYERPILGLSGFVVVLVIWQLAVNLGLVKTLFTSSPLQIWKAAVTSFTTGAIWPDLAASGATFVIGYVVALIVGACVGFIAGFYRIASYVLEPWISALYATPEVALIPLIILWLGTGVGTNSAIVFLAAIFSVVINVLVGVRSVDSAHLELAQSFGASQMKLMRTIVLPTALPFFLTGARIASGRALVGVVVAEFVAANQGIGFMMSVAGNTLRTDRLMVGLAILGIFGMLLGEVIGRIERHFDRWRPNR
jgi:NitT/TauT family transport system permease protein